jgi:membrane-associated phospholipid phosphatase
MSRRLAMALVVAAVGLAVFVAETIVVTAHPGPTGLDTWALDLADDLYSGAGVAVAKVVSLFGALPATATLALIGVVLLARRRRHGDLAVLLGSAVAIYIAVHVAKAAVDRPRPPNPHAHATLAAFPSGHAAYSTIYVAAAVVIASRATLVLAALVAAFAIGASRVYLRVHWATDVLGGWALGAVIFGAATAMAVAVGRFRNNDEATCTRP